MWHRCYYLDQWFFTGGKFPGGGDWEKLLGFKGGLFATNYVTGIQKLFCLYQICDTRIVHLLSFFLTTKIIFTRNDVFLMIFLGEQPDRLIGKGGTAEKKDENH